MQVRKRELIGGAAVGMLNGLFGGGGGMVAVPVLKTAGRDAKHAHATAIAVILPASAASSIVYLVRGFIPFGLFLPVVIGVVAGGALGARLLSRVSGRTVTFIFALTMLVAGLGMILR